MTETTIVAEPGTQEVVISRVFDAPRELVYRAYTDPSLIPDWWGPDQYRTTVDEMEVRPGGRWRFVQVAEDGGEHAFHGVYHDATGPERLVQTFEYEGAPGNVLLETMTFEDVGGKTKVTGTSVFQSVAARDGMLAAGMTDGARRTYERLAELVAKLVTT
jgi:uncharacterized protein YndB with AHSA1/START domain